MSNENDIDSVIWRVAHFNNIDPLDFYAAAVLRVAVFVVEQECPYLELDGADPDCYHLIGQTTQGQIVATARVVPAGGIYTGCSIGRVVVDKPWRGKGLGQEAIERCHHFIANSFGRIKVNLAAQEYLLKFYQNLGYKATGNPYLWDGISHIDMEKQL